MKSLSLSVIRSLHGAIIAISVLLLAPTERAIADPATVIFQDDFNDGLPGWTAVRPVGGAYIDGPMLWCYDKANNRFFEDSNIYTDAAGFSSSRIAVMLINDTVAPASGYSYTARVATSDNDGFGLIFNYENESTFYRITFAEQARALGGWPAQGVWVDRMNNSQPIDLYGPDNTTFIPTIGQPFDVTIAVTNSTLTLTIVDNPLVSPVTNTYPPVALPSAPSGKVGMFSWGQMGAGTIGPANVRSFMIQDPTLSPTPLAGAGGSGNITLTNWSFVIPLGGPGITNATVRPDWSYGIDVNGGRGTLINHDDQAPNNVLPASTNFLAASAVAGDVNWSNYVYTVRFLQNDDDGFGMLLRYQDQDNFYRLAFRNQNAQTGIKRGLTVQKKTTVGGYEQMYSNSVAGFIPPYVANARSPFEVHAFIRTNRLQIIAIKAPDTAPTAVASGPIDMDITPGTVNQGKIGIFSWAQYADGAGTEVDRVKVSNVSGEALIVASPVGTSYPPVGLHDFPLNSVITATNDLLVSLGTGIRQTNTGWAGIGSVPATGFSNRVDFTLTNFSSLTWTYQLQYLLTTDATAGGTVGATLGPWVNANATVTVRATNNPGFVFTSWSGDSLLTVTNLTFPMARPVTLTANFAADSDGDGLPDSWELSYFGNLSQDGTGDPDADGILNLVEFQNGTNPNFAEIVTVSDGLSSQWTNTSRDPGLPGEVTVVDFGSGYRGAFNNNNENRFGNDITVMPTNNYGDFASFQTQRMIVRSNVWNPAWGTNFSASWEISVGDNDGESCYFRYLNESNWFRVTLCGEAPQGNATRPDVGLSVQWRTNGFHTNVPLTVVSGPATVAAAYTDPTDGAGTPAGFKKVRVTVSATNQVFEVRVIGWNAFLATPDFDPAYELIATFTNTSPSLQGGRIGFANWGQGGFGAFNAINGIPIGNGGFFDNIVVKSPADGPVVFSENFETAALATNLPAGWQNPYAGGTNLQGNWVVNVDGAISQLANQGGNTTGTALDPKADADGNILLAPNQTSRNYFLQVGFHAFDNDGVGIVYDYQDTNNLSRVIFRQEATFQPDVPPGLSVSRKSGGVWADITAGDASFLYTPGRPFEVTLGNNNGDYNLVVRDLENPAAPVTRWHWTAPSAAPTNRFGVTTWFSANAHVLYARAFALPTIVPLVPFKITNISRSGGNVVLDISKPADSSYHVLRATSVTGPYVTNAANQTASQYVEPASVGNTLFYRLQLVP